jgi:poly-gamma-glutamate synthesis protein (capsule biosynthesis protein)
MFGGFFGGQYAPKKPAPGDALAKVDALIKSDLAMANLETAIMRERPQKEADKKKMRFVAEPEYVKVLPAHGVTAVSVANNHQLDMRAKGAAETLEILTELGITYIGAARTEEPLVRVETIEVKGWKIGFIAATAWANNLPKKGEPKPVFIRPYDKLTDAIVPVIDAAKADHDAVIVVLHWGVEYEDEPLEDERTAAHAFIDHGAIAVIGSHPHVLQGIERYKGGVIAYSLGNFVFRNTQEVVRQAGVLRLALRDGKTFDDRCLERLELHPTIQVKKDFYHPVPADEEWFPKVATRLTTLSDKIDTAWETKTDRLATPGGCK